MSNFKFQISNRVGFTLVEILVIIAVLAIVTGISWSAFRSLQPSLKLGSVARDLTGDLRSTQQLAVTEQVKHGIRFSATTNEYRIIKYGTTTQEILKKSLPDGISFWEITGFSQDEVIFNPYGAVKEMGEVSLINTKGEVKIVEVRPSGFVRIK